MCCISLTFGQAFCRLDNFVCKTTQNFHQFFFLVHHGEINANTQLEKITAYCKLLWEHNTRKRVKAYVIERSQISYQRKSSTFLVYERIWMSKEMLFYLNFAMKHIRIPEWFLSFLNKANILAYRWCHCLRGNRHKQL
jgi:hypothetical protein